MTGGQLEADEIVFGNSEPSPDAGDEETQGGPRLDQAEMRAMWLRRVQTRPADFLRHKFAYQHAQREAGGGDP